MAWTTMHFALGMSCTGAVMGGACLALGRGWKWIPAVMTLGGCWALIPDMPGSIREQLGSLPLAGTLGSLTLEHFLHSIGDLFFFHKALDAQPNEWALHGLAIILILYNISLAGFMFQDRKLHQHPALRAWRAHHRHLPAEDDSPSAHRTALPRVEDLIPPPKSMPKSTPKPTPRAQARPLPHRAG
ncbi:MAG: hypothetical protein IT443_02890 [Phycisphaeraceae bacterium]|nr:hypothetical protein [Phycisphaeraceae bacterium]